MFDFCSYLVPLTTTPSESTQIILLSKQSSHMSLLVADEVERELTLSMHLKYSMQPSMELFVELFAEWGSTNTSWHINVHHVKNNS